MREKKAVKPVMRMPTSFRELTSRLEDAVGLSLWLSSYGNPNVMRDGDDADISLEWRILRVHLC